MKRLRAGQGFGGPGGAGGDMEQLVTMLNKSLKCPICSDRYKNCIIVGAGCNHLFCEDCIRQRLSSRNRKCPGCGQTFSSSQVHVVAGLEPGHDVQYAE